MNIRQFATNHQKSFQFIPEKDREEKEELSVLGLKWNIPTDSIIIEYKPWTETSITKRKILAYIASHFDP